MENVPQADWIKEAMTIREESDGVGVVVENVAWGPRGIGVLAAWLFGWAVRAGLTTMFLPCVLMEMRAWKEVGYPFVLQCLLYPVCVLGVGSMAWLMATNPCEVREDDVLQVPPLEAVTWTWCAHCNLLRSPGAVHCFFCHRCIDGIHHHCVALWRCIGKKSLPVFIVALGTMTVVMLVNFLMIRETTISFRGTFGNYIIALPVLFLLIHSILSLYRQDVWSPPQVYPRSAFVVRSPHSPSGAAPFIFNFSGIPSRRGELLRMIFRLQVTSMASPKSRKIKRLLQCPKNECHALANPFWLTGGSGGMVECNICEAAFRLPENSKGTLLDRDFLAERDAHCLLRDNLQARPRPRLVFVLDFTVPEVRSFINDWATASHGLPDIKVMCYETRTYRLYVDGNVQRERANGCHSLGAMVGQGMKEVAAHGGKLVLISGSDKHGLEKDVLEALVVAASRVTVNMVCVSTLGVNKNPLLQPLVLHHQAEGGGWTRLVERPRDVLKLVQSGIFLFWGVRARGRVRWTPGIQVVKTYGRGVACTQGQHVDSFSIACLDQKKQVEFSLKVDPAKVLHRRRLSNPEDNTVYFQLHLLYTTSQGKAALAVFNRAFNVD